ncbi:exodeoxyribonuclease V subunit alpha [Synechococcus sp. HJ21-Hayes]|uniref:exodeoxyribonuclease V subunit alpha n=1 Tax=unclassified Synechococcus TaxID=2626047 RepID=UPI0020CD22D0|nr:MULTISPECIES: exodeoxyribonuclease V subunit alpha [unclassified Synechococcus]MCP9831525.1 exodeoxyribonuclease V subunit alpha [Synechococcus sp. JJ3a-Johnson]MCP9853070.1 exodeoxyribonuclease V subunit alpha [Synechococcus sp. HJ21-Hayes]
MTSLAVALQETLPRLGQCAAEPAVLELIAALASGLERGELELNLAGAPPEEISPEGWPSRHRQALAASPLVALAEASECNPEAPLVLDGLQLRWRRWHVQLQTVLENLQARAQQPLTAAATDDQLQQALAHAASQGLDRRQQQAVQAVLCHSLVLLGGGPGTGKTSTVVQMLAAALRLQPQLRLHLAAPTGKAATRLGQAVVAGASHLDADAAIAERLQQAPCSTLHRLLESSGERFGRHQRHPLALDLLVVDEVSMVDLPLMQALLHALPPHGRLLLVGDPAQLPPVGPGAVLLELCKPQPLQALGEAAVELTTTYRNNGAIAAVAQALRPSPTQERLQLDSASLITQLQALGPNENLRWHTHSTNRLPQSVLARLREHQQTLAGLARELQWPEADSLPQNSEPLLAELEQCILLTPMRQGPWGVDSVHRQLLAERYGQPIQAWPLGTPVLNQRNLPEQGLANGDIGVLVDRNGERLVLFPSGRLLHPARLSQATPALALTIHKSQGSQYAEVLLLMPPTRHWDPRLLYTGLTRARSQALLVTPDKAGVSAA